MKNRHNLPVLNINSHLWAKTLGLTILLLVLCADFCLPLDYLPLSSIKPGMKGYGRTVFFGNHVENFNVVIEGIIPKGGPSGEDLLLIRVSGKTIESKGGISLGMSGSPVYMKGKLVGAVSMNFPEEDSRLGGVTPIESMVNVMGYGEAGGRHTLPTPVLVGNRIYREIAYCPPECKDETADKGAGILHARLAMSPVMINGLSPRAYRFLEPYFRRGGLSLERQAARHFSVSGGQSAVAAGSETELMPGSAIAVQLVRGDVDISAVGTLTAMDGKRFVAFGHPLFRKGQVKYLLSDAYVYDIVKGDIPFKIASSGMVRGTVLDDRGSAVVGVIDQFPKLIPLTVTVRDKNLNREQKYSVQIVEDRELIIGLVLSVILQAMDNSIDRIGEGTATISFNISVQGYKGNIERENTHYSRYDISAESLYEVFDALDLITNNELRDTYLSGLKVHVEIDSTASAASIEGAEIISSEELNIVQRKMEQLPPVIHDEFEEEMLTNGATEKHHGREHPPLPVPKEKQKERQKEKEAMPEEGFEETPGELPKVHPGEKVGIKVTIRPYRQEAKDETMFIQMPEDIDAGNAIIEVFSGTKYRRPTAIQPVTFPTSKEETPHPPEEEGMIEQPTEEEAQPEKFEDLVEEFVSRDKNNELVVTVSSMNFSDTAKDKNDKAKKPEETKKTTPWVLNGSATIKVEVEKEKSSEEKKIRKSKIHSFINGVPVGEEDRE